MKYLWKLSSCFSYTSKVAKFYNFLMNEKNKLNHDIFRKDNNLIYLIN